MVAAILQQRDAQVAELCRRHHVRWLEVFGSAADGSFDPEKSDLDFLVEYFPLTPSEHYDAYFGLWEDLKNLFGRKIDLVEDGCISNPYVLRRVNESRRLVYDARS